MSQNFLWKPVSESNGNLVVLLPNQFRDAKNITIITEDGREETINVRHNNHNGNRAHFYASRPGSAYGANVTIKDDLGNTYRVQNGGQRTDSNNLSGLAEGAVGGSNRGPGTSGGLFTGPGGNVGVVPEFFDFQSIPPANVNLDEAFDFADERAGQNRDQFIQDQQSQTFQDIALGLVNTDVQGTLNAANILSPFGRRQGRIDTAENITRAGSIDQFNLDRIPGFNQFNQQQVAQTNDFNRQQREESIQASGINFRERIDNVIGQLEQQTTGQLSSEFLDTLQTRTTQNRGADIAAASGLSGRSAVGRNIQDRLDLDTRLNVALDSQRQLPGVLAAAQQILQPPEQQAPTLFAEPTGVPLNISNVQDRLPVISNISAGQAQTSLAQQATDISTIPAETALSSNLQTQQFNEGSRVSTAFRAGELTQQQYNLAAGIQQGVFNADKADIIRGEQQAAFQAGLAQQAESQEAAAIAGGIGSLVGGIASTPGVLSGVIDSVGSVFGGLFGGSDPGTTIPGIDPSSTGGPVGAGLGGDLSSIFTGGDTSGVTPGQPQQPSFLDNVIDFATDTVPEAASDLIGGLVDGIGSFLARGAVGTDATQATAQIASPTPEGAAEGIEAPPIQTAQASGQTTERQPDAFTRMSRSLDNPQLDRRVLDQSSSSMQNWTKLNAGDKIDQSGAMTLDVAADKGVIDSGESQKLKATASALGTLANPEASTADKSLASAAALASLAGTSFSGNAANPTEIGGVQVVGESGDSFQLANGQTVSKSSLQNTSNTVNAIQALQVLSSNADTEAKLSALSAIGVQGAQANELISQVQAGNAAAALSLFNTASRWEDMNDIEKAVSAAQTGNAVLTGASNLIKGGSAAGTAAFGPSASSSAIAAAGTALAGAGAIGGAILGIKQAATTIDAVKDLPRSSAVGAGAAGLSTSGAAIGASVGLGAIAAGAATGSVVPVVGTAIGAAVGALAGIAVGSTGSGKGSGQKMRDGWRAGLQAANIVDNNFNVTLADGSQYDIGRDGGAKLQNRGTNIDGKTERHTFDVDWSNPAAVESIPSAHIFAIATGMSPASNDFDTFHRTVAQSLNAASSNADSKEGIQQNFRAMLEQANVDPRQVGFRVEVMRQTNQISEEEYGVYLNSLNQMFGSQLSAIDKQSGRASIVQMLGSQGELSQGEQELISMLTDPRKLAEAQTKLDKRLSGN